MKTKISQKIRKSIRVVILFIAVQSAKTEKSISIPQEEDLFFNKELREEDISQDTVKNFLPQQKRPYIVDGSLMTSYFASQNPQLSNEYVRADIELTAINNLRLRQLFINNRRKFDKLFNAVRNVEEELVSTNSKIDEFREDTKAQIDDVSELMKDKFQSVSLDVDTLGTKIGVLVRTVDNNQQKNGANLDNLGTKTNKLTESSMQSMKTIAGLKGNIEEQKKKAKIWEEKDTNE